jgi:hypothetical protein
MSNCPRSAELTPEPVTVANTPADLGLDPNELAPGSRLGRYKVMRLIGRGGMGCVYLAWDCQLRRKVALKVLSAEAAADREARARFLREGRAAAAVTNDHVIAVYETGRHGRTAFLAMQYLKGMSLARYLEQNGIPPVRSAVRIAREVAFGLAAAHACGLLHRDIKPGNVLLEAPNGRAKILDFGLVAPFAPGDEKLTETGMVVGTPAYMSPEQARSGKLDHRSDLFSLGVVLYHMCAGRVPFPGDDTMSVLTALVTRVPEPVGRLNPAVPLRLELLIERLMDKNPAGRPQSASEVVADLQSIERELAGRGSASVAVAATEREPADELDAEVVDSRELEPTRVVDPTPPPKRVRPIGRAGQRKRRARQQQRYLTAVVAVFAVGLVVVLTAAVIAIVRTPPAPPTFSAEREPIPPANVEPRPESRPLPPLPPWWRPGMPLPPEHRPPPR